MTKCTVGLACLVLASSCTSLAGDWEGDMECDGVDSSPSISFSLEKDEGKTYTGDGEIDGFYCGDHECTFDFELDVEAEQASGEQDLDVDLDDCVFQWSGGADDSTGCGDDPEDAEWDGEDTITWEGDFLGYNCEADIDRD